MRKTFIGLLVSLLLVITVGVGALAQVKIKITYMGFGTAEILETEKFAVEEFEKRHPNIDVKPMLLPWDEYNEKIPIMVAAGTAPDMMIAHPALMMELVAWNKATDITEWVKGDPEVNWDDVLFKEDAIYGDKILGLPASACAHGLRWNKDLFAEAGLKSPNQLYYEAKEKGWNWETFVEYAKKLTLDKDGDGHPEQYGVGPSWGGVQILESIRSLGGRVFDSNLNPTECLLDTPESKRAIKALADLTIKHHVMPPPTRAIKMLGITFETGRIAMDAANTAWTIPLEIVKDYGFKWDFVIRPAGAGGFRVWADTDQMIISSSSKHKREVFEFVKWKSSSELWHLILTKLIPEKGIQFPASPPRKSILEMESWRESIAPIDVNMVVIALRGDYIKPMPFTPRSKYTKRVVFTILPTEMEAVWTRQKNSEQAAEDMTYQINKLLQGR